MIKKVSIALLAALLLVVGALVKPQEKPNPVNVKIVDIIPSIMGGETNQDSEPFLSVDPADPSRMAISAFTPDSAGEVSHSAPVFVSFDSGKTWAVKSSLPIAVVTADITHAYAGEGLLHAAALRLTDTPQGLRPDMIEVSANDPALTPLMRIQATRQKVDQPFVATVGKNHDSVYIGENYLGGPADGTASVEVSRDKGAHFTKTLLESRGVFMQDGPSIRLAFARDGKSYAAYFGWRNYERVDNQEGWITSDVVLARNDKGGSGQNAFSDLKDDSDQLPGKIVAKSVRIHWSNKPTLGQERTGSTLSLAVEPTDSSHVYVAWADNMGPQGQYTIHVRRSTDAGKTWKDIKQVPSATCVSLAVAENGTLGFLYHRLRSNKWETHLEQSNDDFGKTSEDSLLANVSANLPLQFLPYLGDYNSLQAVNQEFRGVFSANNLPSNDSFPLGVTYLRNANKDTHLLKDQQGKAVDPSIDPFFFTARVLDNPSKPWTSLPQTASLARPKLQAVGRSSEDRRVMTPQLNNPDADLESRLKTVDVVVVGQIVAVRDASPTFASSSTGLTAVPTAKTRISEHDPDMKEAVIDVKRPVTGVKSDQKTLVVRFPGSLDVTWRNYPKLKKGQEGLFLLKKEHADGGSLESLSDGTPLYSPPTKQDVLNADQVEKVIRLLKR
jgi:hypothetical protein